MANSEYDTIVAIATPPGKGGVGIIRISGKLSSNIALSLLGCIPALRQATLQRFKDEANSIIDTGLAIFFAAPASFTGEDVLELQGHGGPVVMDLLIKRILQLGARLAEPGEFSRRAFLNDKLDLVQAEAIADLISAESAQSARAAMRSMQGEFSQRLHDLTEAVINARMHVEAAIDFPDEELDLMQDQVLIQRLRHALTLCTEIQQQAQSGSALREGLNVVIAGKPNAGKSSILNCLAGYEAAIVTDVPGTTRDVLRERILIDGMPVHILDTAGLRETSDRVEAEGIKRAHQEIRKADHVLYVVDASNYDAQQLSTSLSTLPKKVGATVLMNKCDLIDAMSQQYNSEQHFALFVSASKNLGIDELRQHLKQIAGFSNTESGLFLARRRHLDALQRARDHLQQAQDSLMNKQAGELCAEELRLAQQQLSEITGEFSSDDLLGRIFSTFCIGK
ncbi:MAG TPA: tRNA uridine-5-carboxymethylaminomethyl(34) synthesis GTPase MnmE [Steroidobacteraceae bacterium]|nr:tRNA uridine-5-carboxymethylaminomethyl(34) synthesis GTPase MnmE [Steroidobacteraceae bacterium]